MSLIEIVWGGGALVGGAVMGARTYRVSRIVLVNLMYLVVGLSFALSGLLSPAGFLWFALFTAAAGISGIRHPLRHAARPQPLIRPPGTCKKMRRAWNNIHSRLASKSE